jgi:hypothetical protein
LGTIKSSYSIGKTNMLKSSQKRQIAKFQIWIITQKFISSHIIEYQNCYQISYRRY